MEHIVGVNINYNVGDIVSIDSLVFYDGKIDRIGHPCVVLSPPKDGDVYIVAKLQSYKTYIDLHVNALESGIAVLVNPVEGSLKNTSIFHCSQVYVVNRFNEENIDRFKPFNFEGDDQVFSIDDNDLFKITTTFIAKSRETLRDNVNFSNIMYKLEQDLYKEFDNSGKLDMFIENNFIDLYRCFNSNEFIEEQKLEDDIRKFIPEVKEKIVYDDVHWDIDEHINNQYMYLVYDKEELSSKDIENKELLNRFDNVNEIEQYNGPSM